MWLVRNKVDLEQAGADMAGVGPGSALGKGALAVFKISARRGDGIPELISALIGFAQEQFGSEADGLIGRARQRELLEQAAVSLQRSIAIIGEGEELAAEELRARRPIPSAVCWAG